MMWHTEFEADLELEEGKPLRVHVEAEVDPGRPADREAWQPAEPGEMELLSIKTEDGRELIDRLDDRALDWIEEQGWREIEERQWEEEPRGRRA